MARPRLVVGCGLVAVLLAVGGCTSGGGGRATSSPPTASSTAPPSTSAAPSSSARDLLGEAAPCPATPPTIAGNTWFDASVVRSDVRDGRPGVELDLAFRVVRAGSCTPVPGAVVDLWQADAGGVYSGFAGAGPGDGGAPDGRDRYGRPQAQATDPGRALRGTQTAGADGVVQFTTIFPGWYPTRAPHLHIEVHTAATTVLITQVFFADEVSDQVYAAHAEYRQHGARDTRDATDPFWSRPAQLRLAPDGTRWLGGLTLAVP
jgi:protocatechuate 3,4-dioxygenase beta subunit